MTVLFADSFFYFAYLNPADRAHAAACAFAGRRDARIVTTGFVLVELLDGLCMSRVRGRVAKFVRALGSDPATLVVPATPELTERALTLFEQRQDKEWSFTDCASMVVMRDRGIVEALTGDIHFEQAGFRALLRP